MTEITGTQYKFKDHDLEELWYIMDVLSGNMFSSPRSSIGEKGVYFLSCENVMSVMNTLISIDFCIARQHFSDAFTLARKYRDDLMQYVYLLNVVSRIRGLSDEELNKCDATQMRSTDYLDALEFDEKPIEGSQYWVAPCIVEYMEKNFPEIDKGLLQYIEENNDYGMKFCACDYE